MHDHRLHPFLSDKTRTGKSFTKPLPQSATRKRTQANIASNILRGGYARRPIADVQIHSPDTPEISSPQTSTSEGRLRTPAPTTPDTGGLPQMTTITDPPPSPTISHNQAPSIESIIPYLDNESARTSMTTNSHLSLHDIVSGDECKFDEDGPKYEQLEKDTGTVVTTPILEPEDTTPLHRFLPTLHEVSRAPITIEN